MFLKMVRGPRLFINLIVAGFMPKILKKIFCHLFTRVSEHLERSYKTKNILLNPVQLEIIQLRLITPNSAIRDHSINIDHSKQCN